MQNVSIYKVLLLSLFLNLHVHVHWKHFSLADSPVLQWCFSAPVVARLIKLHVLFFWTGTKKCCSGSLLLILGPKNFLRQQPWCNVLNDCIFLANKWNETETEATVPNNIPWCVHNALIQCTSKYMYCCHNLGSRATESKHVKMQNWCHTTHQRCSVKFMEVSKTMQGVDYKGNRKKSKGLHRSPTNHSLWYFSCISLENVSKFCP